MSEFSIKLTGFKTEEQVEDFFTWYECGGEQHASDWFDESENLSNADVDLDVKRYWLDNEFIVRLKVTE